MKTKTTFTLNCRRSSIDGKWIVSCDVGLLCIIHDIYGLMIPNTQKTVGGRYLQLTRK